MGHPGHIAPADDRAHDVPADPEQEEPGHSYAEADDAEHLVDLHTWKDHKIGGHDARHCSGGSNDRYLRVPLSGHL